MYSGVDQQARATADGVDRFLVHTLRETEIAKLYENRYLAGQALRVIRRLLGIRKGLLDLQVILDHNDIVCASYQGVCAVQLDEIIGSEGRSADYDEAFRPLCDHGAQRLKRVLRAYLTGVSLPAVDLLEIGDGYYVRDGHNRIAGANIMGHATIDAHVTHYDLAPKHVDWDYREGLDQEPVALPLEAVPPTLPRAA